jgi:transglutaminase-like putative cysteine protease
MLRAKIGSTDKPETYLTSTEYLDANHPAVMAESADLTRGANSDVERVERIYYYVRDYLRYDVLESFRYLAEGRRAASDVIEHGVALCMGKANSFVALCRAVGVPARVALQTLESPHMEFVSPEVRALWQVKQRRPLPWHSLGEAFLNGRWVKLDATIDAPTAARLGKPYTQEFDGITDIHTVEGPIVRENGSYADYPPEVGHWYERLARAVIEALNSPEGREKVADDDDLWTGPRLEDVAVRRSAPTI